jgi:hypothetical protein
LKLLYWWISASPKMAQKPTGQKLDFDDILNYQKNHFGIFKNSFSDSSEKNPPTYPNP